MKEHIKKANEANMKAFADNATNRDAKLCCAIGIRAYNEQEIYFAGGIAQEDVIQVLRNIVTQWDRQHSIIIKRS